MKTINKSDTKPLMSGIQYNSTMKCWEAFLIAGEIETEERATEAAKNFFDAYSTTGFSKN